MKALILKAMAFTIFLTALNQAGAQDPSKWSQSELDKWFNSGEWHKAWKIAPDASVDKREFAKSYFAHKERWDKAFHWLATNNLTTLEMKKYELDGDKLYATVSEYLSKNIEDSKYEAHRSYIDIQYVASGSEMIGISAMPELKSVTDEYNATNDIAFFTVKKYTELKADPGKFFIFFPSDLHRPGVKVQNNETVRKIVVKVKVD